MKLSKTSQHASLAWSSYTLGELTATSVVMDLDSILPLLRALIRGISPAGSRAKMPEGYDVGEHFVLEVTPEGGLFLKRIERQGLH